MNATALWDSMWRVHDKTKQLLLFAIPGSTEKAAAGRKTNQSIEPEPRSYKRGQLIGLILGPLLFLLSVLFFSPEELSSEGRMVFAITLWVATWWITEAIPIPATSLLPIILLPITSALPMDEVTASYGNPIVFLFLGGFMIALAMEKWNLHKRIALNIISVVGTSTSNIVLGFMIATGFLSMWVSNTAAVMMMIPIGTAITYQVSQALKGSSKDLAAEEEKFSKVLIFAIGYAGTIGGLGTLIGTPPNIILAGIVSELYGVQISFGSWMLFAVPVVILLLFSTWFYLVKVAHPMKIKEIPGGKELIRNEKSALGRMSFEEKAVSIIFIFAAFMWISQTFLWKGIIPGIDDTMVAITAGVIFFLIPAKKKGERLLDWSVAKDIPWGILLLFGGGLAIAGGFSSTGLAEWLGNQLKVLDGVHFLIMIIVVTTFVLFLTEITSNTATATMILPVLASLAVAINVHPYAIMVPAAMAANCAFMLPVGTPPNAIIFATGKLKITEMVKHGFWVNIFCVILIVGAVYLLLPVLWGVDLQVFPDAFKS
ncbi:DASS family sodium-coupled anion symporter [Bacillus mangrovi]|uniref:Sodium-dependent dicarboxylate transporter SdcS n=1 Tax=Metabacillus mangrovi TaxID=1491830 RepID=A0A7X2S7Z3_9BACI|nr:DASS family sodium-coupled anion symporter [Metabacillus mangrovi]MTH54938.1 DASS family sodium-coupled anion symporter [Metabacillus mangrovi]